MKLLSSIMEILLRPKEAAKRLGISVKTIQRMDSAGTLKIIRTPAGRRRIPESEVHRLMGLKEIRVPVLYARVSTYAQKDELERQIQLLKKAYPEAELFQDIRSGLKFDRHEFLKMLEAVQQGRVSKVVVVYEDRLARFGVDLLRRIFKAYNTELEVLKTLKTKTEPNLEGIPEEELELAKDLISIITSLSTRLYGLRSHKTKKLIATAQEVIKCP
jgi:putative resolvase